MHTGGPSSGHYYAYVRPNSSSTSSSSTASTWYRVDDERVEAVSAKLVLQDAYGGGKRRRVGGLLGGLLGRKSTGQSTTASAYMLQYVRRPEAASQPPQ
jgi:Ubiquitin carboxyl-terminal hydrolase